MIVHVSLAFLVSRTLVGRHVRRRAYTRPIPARIRNNSNRLNWEDAMKLLSKSMFHLRGAVSALSS
jgi:hypothetical protein